MSLVLSQGKVLMNWLFSTLYFIGALGRRRLRPWPSGRCAVSMASPYIEEEGVGSRRGTGRIRASGNAPPWSIQVALVKERTTLPVSQKGKTHYKGCNITRGLPSSFRAMTARYRMLWVKPFGCCSTSSGFANVIGSMPRRSNVLAIRQHSGMND